MGMNYYGVIWNIYKIRSKVFTFCDLQLFTALFPFDFNLELTTYRYSL